MSSALIRHGWNVARRLEDGRRAIEEEMEFSLEVFIGKQLHSVHCSVIRVLPRRLGLFQNEFRNKFELLTHPNALKWSGGDPLYADAGLQARCRSSLLKSLHETRDVIPVVQANARSRTTRVLLWKLQFEGVLVFDAGTGTAGPYTMRFLSGRKMAGVMEPVVMSTDPIESFAHYYFSR